MAERKQRCATCRFWNGAEGQDENYPSGVGLCQRHPPNMIPRTTYVKSGTEYHFREETKALAMMLDQVAVALTFQSTRRDLFELALANARDIANQILAVEKSALARPA